MKARLCFLALLFSALLVLASPAFSVGGSAPSGEGVSPGCEAVIDDGGGRRGQCSSAGGMPGGVFRPSNINQADIALLADVVRARYADAEVDGELCGTFPADGRELIRKNRQPMNYNDTARNCSVRFTVGSQAFIKL